MPTLPAWVPRTLEILAVRKGDEIRGIRTEREEIPLWNSGISSILGALGRRFDPWPSTVG